MDLVNVKEFAGAVWDFSVDGYRVKCQHIERARGVHIILVTQNDLVIERHEVIGDPSDPAVRRRLKDISEALRGIYRGRFARALRDRRK